MFTGGCTKCGGDIFIVFGRVECLQCGLQFGIGDYAELEGMKARIHMPVSILGPAGIHRANIFCPKQGITANP
jgi:hypothetical protein